MALTGDLAEFGLEQILRLLDLSASTGRLTVRGPDARLSLEVHRGAVAAVRGDEDGEAALGFALAARVGTFSFASAPVEGEAIASTLDELLERARTSAAELTEIRASVPSDDVRFRMSERAMTGSAFTLTAAELRVLTAVGGGKSVKDLRRSVRLPAATIRALLHSLVRKDLVERTEAQAEIVVSTAAAPRPKRARKKPAEVAPAATAEPAVEFVAADPATRPAPAEIEAPALREELDARLAALASFAPEPPPPAPEPVSEERPASEDAAVPDEIPVMIGENEVAVDDDRLIVVTPSAEAPPAAAPGATEPEATVVFRLHYLPETVAPPPAPEAAPAPKRRGIFDFLMKRGTEKPAKVDEMLDIPSPADLGSLANALQDEYARIIDARAQLGSFGDRASAQDAEAIPARLGRIYASRPIGGRVPVASEHVDIAKLRSGDVAPTQVLPYLALLVRDIRDEMRRTLGDDDARGAYDATVANVFGKSVATPTRILKIAEQPLRGRLTVSTGPAGGPYELRDRTYVIGRSPACDIVVNDPSVSGRHARLIPDVVGFRLSDLGSTNGTSVDGEKLTAGDRVLKGGEKITFGDAVLLYEHVAVPV